MFEQESSLNNEVKSLLGESRFEVWTALCDMLDNLYDMERIWGKGGKNWRYEYKYRRGGKTLCALYAKQSCFGFMIIFGKAERNKFESERANYSKDVLSVYDESVTYHDGKWMMFELHGTGIFRELEALLRIKRKPNKK